MGAIVVAGAKLTCPFGAAPSNLIVSSACLIEGKPIATIKDVQPNTNIPPFGMCSSMANPLVASATSAAMGVLTPQPCSMLPTGTWLAVKPTVMIGGTPCLSSEAALTCAQGGGQIVIVSPGQTKVTI